MSIELSSSPSQPIPSPPSSSATAATSDFASLLDDANNSQSNRPYIQLGPDHYQAAALMQSYLSMTEKEWQQADFAFPYAVQLEQNPRETAEHILLKPQHMTLTFPHLSRAFTFLVWRSVGYHKRRKWTTSHFTLTGDLTFNVKITEHADHITITITVGPELKKIVAEQHQNLRKVLQPIFSGKAIEIHLMEGNDDFLTKSSL